MKQTLVHSILVQNNKLPFSFFVVREAGRQAATSFRSVACDLRGCPKSGTQGIFRRARWSQMFFINVVDTSYVPVLTGAQEDGIVLRTGT